LYVVNKLGQHDLKGKKEKLDRTLEFHCTKNLITVGFYMSPMQDWRVTCKQTVLYAINRFGEHNKKGMQKELVQTS